MMMFDQRKSHRSAISHATGEKIGGARKVVPLLLVFMLALAVGCSRYPTIPEVEKLDKRTSQRERKAEGKPGALKIPEISKPVSIGEEFQRKVAGFISEEGGRTDKDYVIGPEDVLKIQVWDNEDLNRTVYVSREGEFSYPLIGKVVGGGLTVSELEKEITDRLAKGFIVDPPGNSDRGGV